MAGNVFDFLDIFDGNYLKNCDVLFARYFYMERNNFEVLLAFNWNLKFGFLCVNNVVFLFDEACSKDVGCFALMIGPRSFLGPARKVFQFLAWSSMFVEIVFKIWRQFSLNRKGVSWGFCLALTRSCVRDFVSSNTICLNQNAFNFCTCLSATNVSMQFIILTLNVGSVIR